MSEPFRTLRILLSLFMTFLICLGCHDGHPETCPLSLSSGETLFDVIDRAHVDTFPASNLPPPLASRMREPFLMRYRDEGKTNWQTRPITPEERARYDLPKGVSCWTIAFEIYPKTAESLVRILDEKGDEIEPWQPGTPFPGLHVFWDHPNSHLCAYSRDAPGKFTVEFWADPLLEIGTFERHLALELTGRGFGSMSPPPRSLVRRETLGKRPVRNRPCLLLPAPGCLSLSLDSLDADGIELVYGCPDRSWDVVDGMVERRRGMSDGVRLALEAMKDGVFHRVWEATLLPQHIWHGFREEFADLRPYRGRPVTLRLVSEPIGNDEFDYAVWSGLRLVNERPNAPERPHIVLIDIDTLRADRMSYSGRSPRPTTPHLDQWAAEHGTIFTSAMSTASWTLPATASMLTGLGVHEHGIDHYGLALTEDYPLLARLLHDEGYETFGRAQMGFLSPSFGFDLGFDVYDLSHHKELDWSYALDWIRSRRAGRPLFLFLHTYFVHDPYRFNDRFESKEAPYRGPLHGQDIDYRSVIRPYNNGELDLSPEDRAYIGRMYDAGVAEMDRMVARFLKQLDSIFKDQEYMVVFTSDHGEEFFERGGLDHGRSLYDEVLHIPLIIRFPKSEFHGTRRDDPVSLLDIVPTILECAGIDATLDYAGRSLRRVGPQDRDRVAQLHDARSLHYGDFKLIDRGTLADHGFPEKIQLFNLKDDAGERHNLARTQGSSADRMRRRLDRFLQRKAFSGQPSSSTPAAAEVRALRELGYLVQ